MGNDICVSLFASAVRPAMWKEYLDSLKSTTVSYEVVFSGFNTPEEVEPFTKEYPELRYIHTGRIKPSQNYEISRRACTGETISWSCDDASYAGDVLGKAYRYWKSKNNEKLILSIQTSESGYNAPVSKMFDMEQHRFYGGGYDTPLMAPMALMSRRFLEELGGLDRRYVCGQYENDLVMRAYSSGATVEIFGDKNCFIDIDHLRKSIGTGESIDIETFEQRPFAKGYSIDRRVLENSWSIYDHAYAFKILSQDKFKHEIPMNGNMPISLRKVVNKQLDEFEPYAKEISYTKSESNNIEGMWE